MNVGKQCKWKDIKVGEVFAFEACWTVFYKLDGTHAMLLDADTERNVGAIGNIFTADLSDYDFVFTTGDVQNDDECIGNFGKETIYKLPKDVQQLWRCD